MGGAPVQIFSLLLLFRVILLLHLAVLSTLIVIGFVETIYYFYLPPWLHVHIWSTKNSCSIS